MSVFGGATNSSHQAVIALAATAAVFAGAVAGCGEGEGVETGATVRVYVVEPLCAEAEEQLQRNGSVGDVRVEAVCLPKVEREGKLKLAAIGANARRATEDSTSIAYLEAQGPGNEFSAPILESAEIAQIASSSGTRAMAQLLRAIDKAPSSGSLRASVSEELK